MSFAFYRPTEADAERILNWRTKPEITRHMFSDIPYDLDKQRAWLAACETRTDYEHFVITFKGEPLGLLSYAAIDRASRHCVPGIYMDLPPGRRSIASLANPYLAAYAFCRLGMNKILYYIMATNENFIRGSRAMGVHEVGVLRQHVFKYGQFHDVVVFEKTRAEWEQDKRLFPLETMLLAFPD